MSLKKEQKIYVNRSLNMSYIKAIGFDMDHTLAPYNHVNFETLAFRETLKKFIANGYPEELSTLQFDPNSVMRGLMVDRERGNLLKVDAHKYVKLAFHGKRKLDKEDRHKLYNVESFKAEKLLSIDTFFALSEVQLFIELVDYMDKHPTKIQKTYNEVYQDLRRFIDESHRDGSIKQTVIKQPENYIIRDKYLSNSLMRLIQGGKILFLLTNSDWNYTNAVMTYLLDNANSEFRNWREYFNYVIVSAGKPKFFTGDKGFLRVDLKTAELRPHKGKLSTRHVYNGGSANKLQELIGVKGDEVLYVGDHIYGDIIRSKGLFNWRTMLILEELENELSKLEATKEMQQEIFNTIKERESLEEDTQRIRSLSNSLQNQVKHSHSRKAKLQAGRLDAEIKSLEDKIAFNRQRLSELDKIIRDLIDKREEKIHPVWGEVMKVGLEKSRFANQVEQYACIYSSRLTNLRFYSPYKRFVSFHDLLPHEIV